MTAVWMRARNELRSRWRALVSLALIAGIGGGAAIAAAAGARRAESVYPRFRAATNAFDELIGVTKTDANGKAVTVPQQFAVLQRATRLQGIVAFSLTDALTCTVTGPSGVTESQPDIFPVASPDGRIGTTISRLKMLSGRLPDPSRADEGVLSPIQAHKLGAGIGSTLTLRFPDVERDVHVVGIGIAAGEVDPTAGGYVPILLLTPAFYAQNEQPDHSSGPALVVTIRGGSSGRGELAKELAGTDSKLQSSLTASPQTDAVRRTAGFQAVGLAIFAGLAILTVLAIFSQLLARQVLLESNDHSALRALGMSDRQLAMLSLVSVAVVGFGAAIIAMGVAIAASPLFPIGVMRQVEVSPGLRVDGIALGIGGAATLVLILLAGVWPSWRAGVTTGRERGEPTSGTNRAANALAHAAFPPSAVAGVRMALEPGRGATSVPVRTTIFGLVLALTTLTASLGFGASLHSLVTTPALSGWNFDVWYGGNTQAQTDLVARRLISEGTASSYAVGGITDVSIDNSIINALFFKAGSFGPSIISGRAPQGSRELALGPKTMRAFHTAIGKTISVQLLDPNTDTPVGTPSSLLIVGAVATPKFYFNLAGGDGTGAAISDELILSKGVPASVIDGGAFFRFARGVSLTRGVARIKELASDAFILQRSQSNDLANLNGLSNLPNVGAALLALVAAGTLIHTLVTSVRRRRRDLAILRALGFLRRQVGLTVVWQATTIIVISLAIGLPVGTIAGRLGWRLFVGQLGYVPLPIVPLLEVLLTIPAAIVLANVIASIPARAAARTQAAAVLRAE